MKDDSFDCTLIAHLRIFLLFYRLLYCLILPENRLFFGIWKVVEIECVLAFCFGDIGILIVAKGIAVAHIILASGLILGKSQNFFGNKLGITNL